MTKVFTSLLLADMVHRGEVALTDPVSKYLPPNVKMPERGGKKITLIDLATHTSGLPRLPSNFYPKDPANPYADYTVAQLYEFLAAYQLTRDIGSKYEYSNLGGGLLGHALACRAGPTTKRWSDAHSAAAGDDEHRDHAVAAMKERLATGHDAALQPVANWDLPTLAGAGALRSTANDMLTFLAREPRHTSSRRSRRRWRRCSPRAGRPASPASTSRSAGTCSTRNGNEIVWHNGGTGGYRTWIGFDPKSRIGVVVLSNTSTAAGVDDIGAHLLDPADSADRSRQSSTTK